MTDEELRRSAEARRTASADRALRRPAHAAPSLRSAFGVDAAVVLRSERPEAITVPDTLFIHDLGREGVFVGVQPSCSFDEQRGLGALMKEGVVLGFGFAGVATDIDGARCRER